MNMPYDGRWNRVATAFLAIVVVAVAALCTIRAWRLDYDYHHFKLDADYVWQHGQLNPVLDSALPGARQLPFYLPVVPLALAPLGGLGPAAPLIWGLGQAVCLAVVLWQLAAWVRRCGTADGPTSPTIGGLVLLASPAIYEAARFNQFSFLTLALVLAGEAALSRGRALRAGAWLAAAAVIKLLPAIFLFWLVRRRAWRSVLAFVVTAAALCAAPAAFFGVERTSRYYGEWWEYNAGGALLSGEADAALREHFLDHRNQSIAAVIGRVFQAGHPYAAPHQLAAWDAATCRWLGRGIAASLLILIIAMPLWANGTTDGGDRREAGFSLNRAPPPADFAVYAIAMATLSPLLRQYYLVWALPALTVALVAVMATPASKFRPMSRVAGTAAIIVWIVGMCAWPWPPARSYGAHLALLLVLIGLLGPIFPGRRLFFPNPPRLAAG